MFRFLGLVEFARLAPATTPEVTEEGGVATLRLPGVELQWNVAEAAVAVEGDRIALAFGKPRGLGTKPAASSPAAWLERFARLGDRAPHDVSGAFGIVMIDLAARSARLCVDHFGIETLCYRFHGGELAFSDAAVGVPASGQTVNAGAIYDYLYFHVIPAPETVFDGVRRLQPAHMLAASSKEAAESRYWQPRFIETDRSDRAGRMREFLRAMEAAVAQDADEGRTACFLSGGTDSSTIAGMLARLRDEPTHAYSIGFEAEGYDEMAYARIAARHFRLAHHEYYLQPDDLVDAIPALAASLDQPFGNSSVLPAYFCARRAAEDGFTRILAGDGGDELYGGNSRYALQKVFEVYHRLPAGLRHRVLEPAAIGWPLFTRVSGLRKLGGFVRHAHPPMPDRMEAFNLLHRIGREGMFDPAFVAQIDTGAPLRRQREAWREVGDASLVNRMLAYDWQFTLGDSDLPKVRSAAQLAGVSVGFPFLARDIVDLSLRLPPDWKVKGLRLRWFFKEALRGFLPDEILRKKKHGFGMPFGHWTLRNPRLREFVDDSLEGIARRGIVLPEFGRRLMREMLPEAPGYYGEMAWLLMMLEQWLRNREALAANPPRQGRSVPLESLSTS